MKPSESPNTSGALDISADWAEGAQEAYREEQDQRVAQDETIASPEAYDDSEEGDYEEGVEQGFVEFLRVPLIGGVVVGVLTLCWSFMFVPNAALKDALMISATFAFVGAVLVHLVRGIVETLSVYFQTDILAWCGIALGIGVGGADHLDLMSFTLPMIDIAGKQDMMRMLAYMAFGYAGGTLLQGVLTSPDSEDESQPQV